MYNNKKKSDSIEETWHYKHYDYDEIVLCVCVKSHREWEIVGNHRYFHTL